MQKNVKRVLVLIDGFNFYHKLKTYQRNNKVCVKWLNYYNLVEDALKNDLGHDNFKIEMIYFSAIATWRGSDAIARHKTYIKALKSFNIKVVLGQFKSKDIARCVDCEHPDYPNKIIKHEEKHTDVNIAITLLEKAFHDEFDLALLLSADNDYVPAIKRVKALFPSKKIIICPPPSKKYYLNSLLYACREKDSYRFKWPQIKMHQFSDVHNGLINPWKI